MKRAKQNSSRVGTDKQLLFSKTGESEKQAQTERELWGQEVKKDAQVEASKGQVLLRLEVLRRN